MWANFKRIFTKKSHIYKSKFETAKIELTELEKELIKEIVKFNRLSNIETLKEKVNCYICSIRKLHGIYYDNKFEEELRDLIDDLCQEVKK